MVAAVTTYFVARCYVSGVVRWPWSTSVRVTNRVMPAVAGGRTCDEPAAGRAWWWEDGCGRLPTVSTSAADGPHEFVVEPELAELADRLGVPLHAGDRVRFEVVEGGRSDPAPRRRHLELVGQRQHG